MAKLRQIQNLSGVHIAGENWGKTLPKNPPKDGTRFCHIVLAAHSVYDAPADRLIAAKVMWHGSVLNRRARHLWHEVRWAQIFS